MNRTNMHTTGSNGFPGICNRISDGNVPGGNLLLTTIGVATLVVLVALVGSTNNGTSSLFNRLANVTMLLAVLPCFCSYISLVHFRNIGVHGFIDLVYSMLNYIFYFVTLVNTDSFRLTNAFVIDLVVLVFCTHGVRRHRDRSVSGRATSGTRWLGMFSRTPPFVLSRILKKTFFA